MLIDELIQEQLDDTPSKNLPIQGSPSIMTKSPRFQGKPTSLDSGEYSRHRTGLQHLAFIMESRGVVEEVHRVIVALGGEVVHEPREFPEYHPGYYATFWLDPSGQMLEAVCHKTATGEP